MSEPYLPPLINGQMSKVEFLAANGYLNEPPTAKIKESDSLFKRATLEFQEFSGVVPDGEFGAVSMSRAAEKRCALPDLNRGFVKKDSKWVEFVVAEACTRKWSDSAKNNLTCCHNAMSFSTLSSAETDRVWWQGLVEWMKVCDITFKRVPFSRSANFTHEKESIDGSSGTLAYHYLPGCGSGSGSSLGGRYDSGERWTAAFFQGVHVHEVGHGLGLDHSSNRNDILYPYYDSRWSTPQAGDISRVVSRYGKPTGTTPDDPTTPPSNPSLEQRVFSNEVQIQAMWAAIKFYHGG